MALPPKFAGQRLTFSSSAEAVHTIEIFLDYVCPYSAKLFHTIYRSVRPAISAHPRWSKGVQVLFRHQIQPWHPSSTLTHEAGVAVQRIAPQQFWAFSEELFKHQKEYFDVNVVNEVRNKTYERLAELAGKVEGVDGGKVLELLKVSDQPGEDGGLNVGNSVTNDLKVLVKMARLTGVHVSPTVIFDGVVQNDISSSWTKEQWEEWLEKNIV